MSKFYIKFNFSLDYANRNDSETIQFSDYIISNLAKSLNLNYKIPRKREAQNIFTKRLIYSNEEKTDDICYIGFGCIVEDQWAEVNISIFTDDIEKITENNLQAIKSCFGEFEINGKVFYTDPDFHSGITIYSRSDLNIDTKRIPEDEEDDGYRSEDEYPESLGYKFYKFCPYN